MLNFFFAEKVGFLIILLTESKYSDFARLLAFDESLAEVLALSCALFLLLNSHVTSSGGGLDCVEIVWDSTSHLL